MNAGVQQAERPNKDGIFSFSLPVWAAGGKIWVCAELEMGWRLSGVFLITSGSMEIYGRTEKHAVWRRGLSDLIFPFQLQLYDLMIINPLTVD